MSDEVPEQYRPRQCRVVKWEDFQGYGFNLHAEKGKAGQFIGKVDDNSPAEAAGLKNGDRIVEVNGVNIGNENHQQVVTRIKSSGDTAELLVVDLETDEWYKENKRIVRGDLPEVRRISAERDNDYEDEPKLTDHGQDEDEQQEDSHSHQESSGEEVVESGTAAQVHNGNGINEDDSYRPRLCHLKIWPHFQGYGFNLHAERDKPGQYIGLVDDNSPASTAGLLVQDRIIEVNGANVEKEKHTEVIARIKAIPGQTKLLVVDKRTDNHYKDKGVSVSSTMSQTDYIVTPDAADLPVDKEEEVAVADTNLNAVPVSHDTLVSDVVNLEKVQVEGGDQGGEKIPVEEDDQGEEKIPVEGDHGGVQEGKSEDVEVKEENVERQLSVALPAEVEIKAEKSEDVVNGLKPSVKHTPSEPEHEFTVAPAQVRQESVVASSPVSKVTGDLELNLSVAEMKERLKAKKRQDPRLNKEVSFEQKYKEFQRM